MHSAVLSLHSLAEIDQLNPFRYSAKLTFFQTGVCVKTKFSVIMQFMTLFSLILLNNEFDLGEKTLIKRFS